ncbi:hypothetical protein [Coxiella burnetii]|uniref:Uncharacterized protein n=1 Tax=Coxiella burnetii (strain RSA 493 / Nine Mile phase I) TaxID=227377 RepID=Q83FD2_COXBU|nr:hypothetical protein [Coxiella burnetii]NP_819064.1 hypothetical protein CBU_0008 [Coxiella burnetii RSA 493]AAO89578.1 hypothetical protein CBU_0008 [Coxiella burnetii RSA 493]AML48127.1 hypothetical protein AUR58_02240 [Coxiella burnetii]AML54146.1 hypothetical protein AYM38_01885 [Coxiella burnetii]ARI64937.1 hypothetical protein B7L74_00050 [Coxiella burnetii]ARK26443.1 hypothetical protein BMW92_00050 [Coxiella burnetii]
MSNFQKQQKAVSDSPALSNFFISVIFKSVTSIPIYLSSNWRTTNPPKPQPLKLTQGRATFVS